MSRCRLPPAFLTCVRSKGHRGACRHREPIDPKRLDVLAGNLAIGAALCEAFFLGDLHGCDISRHQPKYEWQPNTDGKAAPDA